MKQLGRTRILSPGLKDSFRVKILDGQAPPADFSVMEFRAGIVDSEGEITALEVVADDTTASIIVSVAPSIIAGLTEDAEIGIMVKREASGQPQAVGYVPVRVVDRGHRWI